MPKPTKGPRLGGSSSHQKAILANLATSLFEHGRIKTTEPKARALRPYAEKLITHAKKGELHNRREVMKKIRDKDIVHALFAEIAPFFADRNGGYTRIIKVEPRKGDNAPMAVIELVREPLTVGFQSFALSQLAIGIRRRNVMAFKQQRCELLASPGVAADGQCTEGIAVVALPARDEVAPLRLAPLDEILTGHLQRRLDGLRAARDEIDMRDAGRSMLDDVIRQPFSRFGREE